MCMPCRTSRSAIFDLATVFSAAVTSFPATRPMDAADGPQESHADEESEQRDRGGAQQRAQAASLGGFFERNLQAGDDLRGYASGRTPRSGCPRPPP